MMSSTAALPLRPVGPRRRASRRKSFVLSTKGSELSQRRRQSERFQRIKRAGKFLSTWTVWRWLLGIAACSEFVSYLLITDTALLDNNDDEEPSSQDDWWSFFCPNNEEQEPRMTMETAVDSFETPALALLYSLYFLDAFVQAYDLKVRACMSNEKERLLHDESSKRRWRLFWNPRLVFSATLLFYWLLLPTWFWWELLSTFGIPVFIASPVIQVSAVEHPQYSLGYAVIAHFYENLSAQLKATLEEQATLLERTIKRRLARFFIFHPRKFIRRYKKVRLAFVWIKYLAPIGAHVMNSNFVGEMVDVIESTRQKAHGRYQQLRRRSMWRRLDDTLRREFAAVIIQRNYRSYRSRKWVRLVQMQMEKQEEEIITLVQKAIRKRSKQELEEQERELDELELLEQHAQMQQANAKMNPWRMTFLDNIFNNPISTVLETMATNDKEELRRKYELQQEIQRKLQLEKQKLMLIRPDSRFVFRYQLIYIVCALIETAHLILQPRLEEQEDERTDDSSWTTTVLRFFFRRADGFVNVILCFGILIKFFVGDQDPVTGRLAPRSFFSRWIYPGLLLHLIVNPALEEISHGVRAVITFALRAGPGRVWRWMILFFLPIWNRLLAWLEWKIWIKLVQRENQNLSDQRPARRRSSIQ